MHYSPEALIAFVEAAALGSFSAAARKLRKSQSTISTAIANLEADLGLTLFDRQARQPVLTDHGRRVLSHVQEILAASERLDNLSIRLAGQVETRLTFVLSDTYQPTHHESLLRRFEQRYPDIEFECLIAEDDDVIDLLQLRRAHIGVVEVQQHYPPDIAASRLAEQTEMAIFVQRHHPLAQLSQVHPEQLATTRQLCLNTYNRTERNQSQGLIWSAPSYLMLMEMAVQGFGWAILPHWMVEQYSDKKLVALPIAGWPKMISIDAVWSKNSPPGPAGYWLLDQLTGAIKPPHYGPE
ncbi:LysR family transcriptional regulator [Yersinia enterocolitica]|uniref:LysR-family transcriptional regulatory protein n=1 Tax=Yersinia enterocolitica serotype O:8 / biotype 1B (strain NCTC 13174 / 8081) TaxID=393305 RepID=A1JLD4_YERE8|nr:LysR family transcriptional regulator [Yersinia enterocolitica]AJJ24490.1 bacterial regulatory helix-turn-helix, lysR family protein [Yersinia enterocolitica]KGA78961.1 bacterial regulatory helix-turn-helix, lysR family protein [Yersinia enterocolitica]PNM08781.1 LysR family transcriptional regulator [Yersinia enterocolitica]PNM19408.1 LysR family transcriptional regulator [Yersinia enterocolitica]CAL11314.1 putative lysR-family transcriptional regulatory protein [Yersinia enterocolitica su